jgi:hypothetical protein
MASIVTYENYSKHIFLKEKIDRSAFFLLHRLLCVVCRLLSALFLVIAFVAVTCSLVFGPRC